jgi:signal transduction histidine kinase
VNELVAAAAEPLSTTAEAALRTIAVLVAHGGPPAEIFAAISEQAADVCGVSAAAVVRFTDEGARVVGRWGRVSELPEGTAFALGGGGALTLVRNTGLPARYDEYSLARGAMGEVVKPAGLRESAAAPVVVDGAVWGALVLAAFAGEHLPPDAEDRLSEFAELASLAVSSADARERLLESRARLVTTADAERKRLERNLHDGAQQRLVSAQLALRVARNRLQAPELDPILEELKHALEELRELARGLHPAALQRGLFAAVGSLASRSPVPVEYEDVLDERLPEPLEVAAYYVIAESITNAAKHADATVIRVSARLDEALIVEIADDGRGGADFTGSGLVGLRDRVEALRGHLRVASPPGAGTTITATFPIASP